MTGELRNTAHEPGLPGAERLAGKISSPRALWTTHAINSQRAQRWSSEHRSRGFQVEEIPLSENTMPKSGAGMESTQVRKKAQTQLILGNRF